MARDPERTIPAVEMPTLAELGLDHLQHPGPTTRWLFLLRPVAAATVAVWASIVGQLAVALAMVPLLYGWTLTLVHHMIHGSLGGGRWIRHAGLSVGGALALHSGHALEATHRQHHLTDLEAADPEGDIELVRWREMPVAAVAFRYRLWAWAWAQGHRRSWLGAEIALHCLAVAWMVTHVGHPLATLLATLWTADVVFAVLAGKGPQTNCGKPVPTPLIAIRARLMRWLLLGHSFHLEHHLYPQVPLPHLAKVAPAIDGLLVSRGALIKRLP